MRRGLVDDTNQDVSPVKSSGDDYRKGARGRQATYAALQKKRGFKQVQFWLKASEVAPMRAHLLELRARGAGGGKIPPLSIFPRAA